MIKEGLLHIGSKKLLCETIPNSGSQSIFFGAECTRNRMDFMSNSAQIPHDSCVLFSEMGIPWCGKQRMDLSILNANSVSKIDRTAKVWIIPIAKGIIHDLNHDKIH